MKKGLLLLIIPLITVLAMLQITAKNEEKPVNAEFVQVKRADVHHLVPIYGQLIYQDEEIITAPLPGTAKQVCVEQGQRVADNAALVRLELQAEDKALIAYRQLYDAFNAEKPNWDGQLYSKAVRAKRTCTVRDIYIAEGDNVYAGMPIMRVTSNDQCILCNVTPCDAEKISAGMWAWISSEGEQLCLATVESVGETKVDAYTGTLSQKVVLVPEEKIEMPEYTLLDADVYLAGSDDVTALPLYAVTDRDTVWWVSDGRCTEIPAQIVMSDENNAWVCLPEGLTVAVGEFTEGQYVAEAHS